jgi:lipopolysaccharide/colanic/teichoic acid biosynthesis glycosyltransferase
VSLENNSSSDEKLTPIKSETTSPDKCNHISQVCEETTGVRFIRRTVDIVLSSAALVITFPLMVLIGIVIKLDSPGPALFRQIRMTKDRRNIHSLLATTDSSNDENMTERRSNQMAGKPFVFVKFRTMYVDAKERFPELYSYEYDDEEIQQIKFKIVDDPRVTRVGRILRKSTLDELPNFWNVLKGDMTLAGPRPEIPEMSHYYNDHQLEKFRVKSGVTGPSQISGRGHLTFQETADLDADYAINRTLKKDFMIILKTIKAIVTKRGAF